MYKVKKMAEKANSVNEYLDSLEGDRRIAMERLTSIFREKLPKGFQECISYGMIGYVVPHDLYPKGYHCDPKLPLPFINLASQKAHLAIYHMGLYSWPKHYEWFLEEWSKQSKKKPDMGKSCLRFKKMEDIPYELIGELAGKISPEEWISHYETTFNK